MTNMLMNNLLAIIPARGGSKGLPGKNIKNLIDKPLIAWTINAAKEASCISKIIVSTDDLQIKEISNAYNADTPFIRPASLSEDNTLGIDVILHALENVSGYEYVCMLQPTSPLRTAYDIESAFQFLLEKKANACVSVTETQQSPFWSFKLSDKGQLISLFDKESFPQRRQELPTTYFLNGSIYIAKVEWLKRSKTFISEETLAFVMPSNRSIDIDTLEDFVEAERILLSEIYK